MHPDWLGSPQHFAAGLVLSALTVVVARHVGVRPGWVVVPLAIAVAMTAESVFELVEYPLLYSDSVHETAYYDTIADLASTLCGAVLGAGAAAAVAALRS